MVTYHDLTFKMNNKSKKYECTASTDITVEQLEVVTNANGIATSNATSNANGIANSTATSNANSTATSNANDTTNDNTNDTTNINATIIGGHTQ